MGYGVSKTFLSNTLYVFTITQQSLANQLVIVEFVTFIEVSYKKKMTKASSRKILRNISVVKSRKTGLRSYENLAIVKQFLGAISSHLINNCRGDSKFQLFIKNKKCI